MSDDIYVVKANTIAAMEGLSKTHFLNPNAKRMNKSLGDLVGLQGIGVHLIEIEPGDETTEYHVHHHEDEAVYVLEGEGMAVIGDREHAIGPGDFIGYRKGGHAHTIHNTGSAVLCCLVVGERSAHDVTDYPHQAKRLYRNVGLPWNLVNQNSIRDVNAGGKK
ncbi:MAG: cupin domain-containing protein [Pseudomonadota bacterium]